MSRKSSGKIEPTALPARRLLNVPSRRGRKLSEQRGRRHFSEQHVLAAPIDKADANFAADDEEYVLGRIVLASTSSPARIGANGISQRLPRVHLRPAPLARRYP